MPRIALKQSSTKRTFWAVSAFYFLIAFEFFYMATPFALYFYSVYGPGLSILNRFSSLGWLESFFLPHLSIDTSSFLLNIRVEIGIALSVIGFAGFCVGAVQTYYHKLARKGVVTKGLYRIIRHPQYASLILCSFGILLLWPRYLVLVLSIAMLFAYYFLARLEEKECIEKYGSKYIEYLGRTYMFFPIKLPSKIRISILPDRGLKRYAAIIVVFLFMTFVSIACAYGLQLWSVNNLYALYEENAAYISITKMEKNLMTKIIRTVLADVEVREGLNSAPQLKDEKFLNYILPIEYYALEIPMTPVKDTGNYHFLAQSYGLNMRKIIFTKVNSQGKDSKGMLVGSICKTPILEVWFDLQQNKVTRVMSISKYSDFAKIPVPLF